MEIRLAGEDLVCRGDRSRGAFEQFDRKGGEVVVVASPYQQVVVEVAAQLGQGRADRRLAQAQPTSGPGDAAFA